MVESAIYSLKEAGGAVKRTIRENSVTRFCKEYAKGFTLGIGSIHAIPTTYRIFDHAGDPADDRTKADKAGAISGYLTALIGELTFYGLSIANAFENAYLQAHNIAIPVATNVLDVIWERWADVKRGLESIVRTVRRRRAED